MSVLELLTKRSSKMKEQERQRQRQERRLRKEVIALGFQLVPETSGV